MGDYEDSERDRQIEEKMEAEENERIQKKKENDEAMADHSDQEK